MDNFTAKVEIPYERIEDLIITGVEGGTNYWMTVEGPWLAGKDGWLKEQIEKGTLKLSNRHAEEDEDGEIIEKVIDHAALQKAIDLMAEKYQFHWGNFINESEDAETGDVFIQLCVLGEIVYG